MFQWPLPRNIRFRGSASDRPLVDNFEEPAQLRETPGGDDEGAMSSSVELRPYAVRLRMIILLALLCWAIVLGVIALIIA